MPSFFQRLFTLGEASAPQTTDLLLAKILNAIQAHKAQANKHKRLHRALWFCSSAIALAIAFCSALPFEFAGIGSNKLAEILAILLPPVTGYMLLRSPEKLWLHEIATRNQLSDLATELELLLDRKIDFDRAPYEQRFLTIMSQASERWLAIKQV